MVRPDSQSTAFEQTPLKRRDPVEQRALDWLIVCPLAIERKAVQRSFPSKIRWRKQAARFWQGEMRGLRFGLLQSGPGQDRAASEVDRILNCTSPSRILIAGLCGGLTPDLPVGACVSVTSVRDAGGQPVRELASVDPAACAGRTLVSVAEPVLSAEAKHELAGKAGAAVVDMESAGIVRVAMQAGLPVSSLRVVSDDASMSLPAEVGRLIRSDGELDLLQAIGLVLRPHLFFKLRELQLASQTALTSLMRAMREIDWDRPAD
ncbi:hypothetical protein [Rubinisphaera sp. JC750]|uniref:phosphorylase family protein n=1 Tax=Rubinisphaera sp. JC750 TaxID=2898658 RepID=UPI001F451D01|nr:hypothetical protein [Rubinisphaera sp. JC750]